MTYRIRNILIAIGLALVAMLLTLFYVTNYKRSVQHSTTGVSVYVAARDITAGTPGADIVKQHDLRVEIASSATSCRVRSRRRSRCPAWFSPHRCTPASR